MEQIELVDQQFVGDADQVFSRLDEPTHPSSRQLYDCWLDCRARHGAMQLGRDIPGRAIPRLLRDLTVLEPIDGGSDFIFRLAGSGFLKRCGSDVKGLRFSVLYRGAVLRSNLDSMNTCIREQKPMIYDVRMATPRTILRRHESIDLPIKSQDGAADLVISGTFVF